MKFRNVLLTSVILLQVVPEYLAQDCMNCTFRNNDTALCQSLGLRHVPDCLPENLRILDLWENNIILTSSSFDHLPNLEYLWLESNNLQSIHADVLRNLTKLKLLGLNNNFMTSVPANLFSNNPEITELQVVNNILTSLDIIFAENSLKTVRASDNQIITIESSVPINGNITVLDISFNHISFLDKNWFVDSVNMSLWLQYNYWNCECSYLLDLLDFFQVRNIRLEVDPTCSTPEEFYPIKWSVARDICLNQTVTTVLPTLSPDSL